MVNYILKYGTVAGLIVGLSLFGMTVANIGSSLGMVAGYTIMLVALSVVFVGVKRYRDIDRGGIIGFWPALGLGLAISAVASIFYVIAWEAALAVTQADFIGNYTRALIEEKRAAGASPEALAALSAEMEQFRASYANPLIRLPMTFTEIFPVGALVSLVTAAVLRNRSFLPARQFAA
jgi:hypothetical protein